MTKAEQMKEVDRGTINCVGSYWAGRLDTIRARSKENGGAARTFYVAKETVLTDQQPIVIRRFLKDDEDPAKWLPSAKKGDKVFVFLESMKIENGNITLNGRVEVITP